MTSPFAECEAEKVLIVDDEDLIRDDLRALFQQEGFEVAQAADGSEALERMSYFQPDVVITDLEMPQCCGTDFVGKMLQLQHLETPPVVVYMSGRHIMSHCESLRLGADAFFQKPFRFIELVQTCRHLIQNQRKVRQSQRLYHELLSLFAQKLSEGLVAPLTIISGSQNRIESLLGSLEVNSEAAQRASYYNESIKGAAEKLQQQLSGLKMLSGFGNQSPDFEGIEPKKLFALLKADWHEECSRRGVDLRIPPSPFGNLTFEGSPSLLRQALSALIQNSLEALETSEDKWISLEAAQFESMITLFVNDSGTGIQPALQDYILLPFFTTKKNRSALGLGLNLVKSIADFHSGYLTLDRYAPNTRFCLALPLRRWSKPVSLTPE